MTRYFMYGTELQELEQLMMMVPNFMPRRNGMIIVNRCKFKTKGKAYCLCDCTHKQYVKEGEKKMTHLELAGEIFQNVENTKLNERLIRLREKFIGEVFETNEHVHNFYQECAKRKLSFDNCNEKLIAVIFIFASTDERLERYYKCILQDEIDLSKADLASISVSDYAVYQAAKTLYTEKTCIYIDELADESLIDDDTFILIVNSFLIVRHGAGILRMIR